MRISNTLRVYSGLATKVHICEGRIEEAEGIGVEMNVGDKVRSLGRIAEMTIVTVSTYSARLDRRQT